MVDYRAKAHSNQTLPEAQLTGARAVSHFAKGIGFFLFLIVGLLGCKIDFSGHAISYPVETDNKDFHPPVVYVVGNYPLARATGDFNSDGLLDVVVLNQLETTAKNDAARVDQPGTISFLFNDGAGGFQVQAGPSPGVRPSTLRVGDLNGDGRPDLVFLSDDAVTLTVLLNGEEGWSSASYPLNGTGADMVLVDLNGDSSAALDVVIALSQPEATLDPGHIQTFVNDGVGGLTMVASDIANPSPDNTPVQLLAEDWNRDGLMDLAVRDGYRAEIAILIGAGDGNFSHGDGVHLELKKIGTDMIAVDLNNDGLKDLAVTSTAHASVTLFSNDGNAGFAPLPQSPYKVTEGDKGPEKLLAGTFSEKGPDLVLLHRSTKSIALLDGNGDGGFETIAVTVGYDPYNLVAADFNGDGHLDLILGERRDRALGLLSGNSKAGFERTVIGFLEPISPPLVADFDGNGLPDLLVIQPTTDELFYLRNCHPAPGAPCP